MEKKIEKVLKSIPEIKDYKITAVHTSSYELFYVQKKLETNRATDTDDYHVTVYIDKDKLRGSSSFDVYPYMSEEEIRDKAKENVLAASFALNPYYPLPKGTKTEVPAPDSNFAKYDPKELVKEIKEAVFKADCVKNGSLSATEIFIYKDHTHIINSQGVDVEYDSYRGNIETIPNWVKKENDEYELYKMIRFSSFDPIDITKQVSEVLSLVHARSEAQVIKDYNPNTNIILEGEEVRQFFSFFKSDLSYASKFNHMNRNEIGDDVQGKDVTGTKLTMKLVPSYPNALASRYADADGVVLHDVGLIENGIARERYGSYQYGYYLGVKNPTGNVPIMVVKEGDKSLEDMKKKPYLRCVRFSGMQLDSASGFIGGEVRLGFYFDGEKEIPVTGLSISGDIHALKGKIIYSKETTTEGDYHGPAYVLIPGMKIM